MENNIIVFTDGGSRGNPGPSACGVVIRKGEGVIKKIGKTLGITTNNVAEYTGVIEALGWITKNRETIGEFERVEFYMDSLLLCQQLKRVYKVKQPHLQMLMYKIRELEDQIHKTITYSHVPREKNKEADAMVNLALDNLL